MPHTFKIGRSAVTGRFMPVPDAVRRPANTVVETIRIPTTSKRK